MNFPFSARNLLLLAVLLLISTAPLMLAASDSQEEPHETEDAGKLYLPSDHALEDLELTLKKAARENKLALVILGANWCHDSRALAARLQTEPLRSLVADNYETLFVNVGNLSEGREVIQALGVPIYYATPTVLIVDPVSRRLVNEGNRHMWGSAASIGMDESVTYFEDVADTDLSSLPEIGNYSAEQKQLLADIDVFEQAQADRLAEAYKITGAMLDDKFDQSVWTEVAKYRNSVAADTDKLRIEVAQRIANGETDIVLSYPEYSPWSWERSPVPAEKP